jgi:hypothetical protein
MKDFEKIKREWIAAETSRILEKRQYPHFDPIVRLDDARKEIIFDEKKVSQYSFSPLIRFIKEERRRKYVEQFDQRRIETKRRPISYASHLDAMIYSWYCAILNEEYQQTLREIGISECVIAYRY